MQPIACALFGCGCGDSRSGSCCRRAHNVPWNWRVAMIEHELRQQPDPVVDDTWVLRTHERQPWLRGYLGNGRLAAQVTADGGLAGSHGVPLHLMAELYDRAEGRE